MATMLALGGVGNFSSAITKTPWASCITQLANIRVNAWFNSGYKTKQRDVNNNIGVQKDKYIRCCWVRLKEGSFDKKTFSKSYTIKQEGQGQATIVNGNNPFKVASASWGWHYNN